MPADNQTNLTHGETITLADGSLATVVKVDAEAMKPMEATTKFVSGDTVAHKDGTVGKVVEVNDDGTYTTIRGVKASFSESDLTLAE